MRQWGRNSKALTCPRTWAVYLSCTAIINGARSVEEVKKTVKAGFMSVLRVRIPPSVGAHFLTFK